MKYSHLFIACLCSALIKIPVQASPIPLNYTILESAKHNPNSFTQGLISHNQSLIETSGLYHKSYIVKYDIQSGEHQLYTKLPDSIFAEGVTLFKDSLYVLSWRSRRAFILDVNSFHIKKTLPYRGEGWGITHDGKSIITSNGTDQITFRNPEDFTEERSISVHSKEKQFREINELEFAKGLIWANIWRSANIIAIDPKTGEVKAIINMNKIAGQHNTKPGSSVLNGIAYSTEKDAFWITGKLWTKRYLIDIEWPKNETNYSAK